MERMKRRKDIISGAARERKSEGEEASFCCSYTSAAKRNWAPKV